MPPTTTDVPISPPTHTAEALLKRLLTLIRDSRDFGDDAKKQTSAALEAFAKQFA